MSFVSQPSEKQNERQPRQPKNIYLPVLMKSEQSTKAAHARAAIVVDSLEPPLLKTADSFWAARMGVIMNRSVCPVLSLLQRLSNAAAADRKTAACSISSARCHRLRAQASRSCSQCSACRRRATLWSLSLGLSAYCLARGGVEAPFSCAAAHCTSTTWL